MKLRYAILLVLVFVCSCVPQTKSQFAPVTNTPVPIEEYHHLTTLYPGCTLLLPEGNTLIIFHGQYYIFVELRDQGNNQIFMDLLGYGEGRRYNDYYYIRKGETIGLYSISSPTQAHSPNCPAPAQ